MDISSILNHNNNNNNNNTMVVTNSTGSIVSTYLVSLSEELKKAIHSDGECRPELIVGRSEILDIEDISNITNNFLGNTHWSPVYSTSLHKRSLEGMYSRLKEVCDNCSSPILILVKDTKKRVFGALISTIVHPSDEDYELEHSTLFQCRPKFETFPNMRDNTCKVRSKHDSLTITHWGGKGELWLNSKLTMGRTDQDIVEIVDRKISVWETPVPIIQHIPQSTTFNIKTVECWVFGDLHF